jgi:hypothetical protein
VTVLALHGEDSFKGFVFGQSDALPECHCGILPLSCFNLFESFSLRRRLMLYMKKLSLFKPFLLVLAGSFLAGGCVYRERTVYRDHGTRVVTTETVGSEVVVTEAPPAPVWETVTVAPAPGYVWVGGAWVWRDHWVWTRGRWARPVRPGAVWIAPRYEYRGGTHVYIRGGWR